MKLHNKKSNYCPILQIITKNRKSTEDANSEIKGAKDEVDKQNNTPKNRT